MLTTALLSGAVCYRIGKFAGCATPWLADVRAADEYYEYYGGGGDGENDGENDGDGDGEDDDETDDPWRRRGSVRSKGSADDDPTDRRTIPRTNLPYDCGVVFFYHIPCTGGASINRWLRNYQRPRLGNFSYYQYWALETRKDGSFHPHPERVERQFAAGMGKHIRDLGPNEWRIAHSHLTSTYLNESEKLLHRWRSDVEAQGCELINAVMLRDPLNHAMSLHKIVGSKNSTKGEWTKYLESPTGTGLWSTVLDFFLYNTHGLRYHDGYPHGPGGRNPFNVTKEEKVRRAMGLLHRHFDVVTVGDHATFQSRILNWTGWTPTDIPVSNVGRRALHFTKREVESLQRLLTRNGDFDFADRARLEYHDYLSYLDD